MKIRMDADGFRAQLKQKLEVLRGATRPAAQAGAQIIYEHAKLIAPESDAPHMFHGTHQIYGPYNPGNLRDSIYQAFSADNSYADVSTYHISWNQKKAPYGWMVELGTSKASARSFIGRAVSETRGDVREAIKARFIQEAGK